MGKLLSGCDIIFNIRGTLEFNIMMGSNMQSNQVDLDSIIKELLKNKDIRKLLSDAVGVLSGSNTVTKEDLQKLIKFNEDTMTTSPVYNTTVNRIVNKYPDISWDGVDLSTKLITAERFEYFGEDLTDSILIETDPTTGELFKIFCINPNNKKKVKMLNSYLKVTLLLKYPDDRVKEILKNSILSSIIDNTNLIYNFINSKKKELLQLKEKEKLKGKLSQKDLDSLESLLVFIANHERILKMVYNRDVDLILDYLDNASSYKSIVISLNNKFINVENEIKNVIRSLQGYSERVTSDEVFIANFLSNLRLENMRTRNGGYRKGSSITYENLKAALELKYYELVNTKTEDSNYKAAMKLSRILKHYIDNSHPTPKDINKVIASITEFLGSEFAYSIDHIEENKSKVFFNTTPMFLSEAYPDINYSTILLFKLVEEYKGYNIYYNPADKKYYYNRHLITTKSYGYAKNSIEECREVIDYRFNTQPICKDTLLELKLLSGTPSTIFIPSQFVPGQTLRSLDININPKIPLLPWEISILYNTGIKNFNNLPNFYKIIRSKVAPMEASEAFLLISKIVDTPEKVACLIYLLEEIRYKEGTSSAEYISINNIKKALSIIKTAVDNKLYKYYTVENLKHAYIPKGLIIPTKTYTTIDVLGNKSKTKIYPVYINEINTSTEFSDGILKYDENAQRLMPSVRLLNDIGNKIEAKLGVKVHVLNQSKLEELFKEWKETMPTEVKGFIKDGEIYINSTNALVTDLFHEYTHLMLGILKARNYDNYQALLNLVSGIIRDKKYKLEENVRAIYKNMSELDIQEEVFANIFSEFLSGRNFDEFLDGTLKECKESIDEKMESIFGKSKIPGNILFDTLDNISRLFGHDLGQLMKEGNGLEFAEGTKYRRASNWINDQIKKYNEAQEAARKKKEKELKKSLKEDDKKDAKELVENLSLNDLVLDEDVRIGIYEECD